MSDQEAIFTLCNYKKDARAWRPAGGDSWTPSLDSLTQLNLSDGTSAWTPSLNFTRHSLTQLHLCVAPVGGEGTQQTQHVGPEAGHQATRTAKILIIA